MLNSIGPLETLVEIKKQKLLAELNSLESSVAPSTSNKAADEETEDLVGTISKPVVEYSVLIIQLTETLLIRIEMSGLLQLREYQHKDAQCLDSWH